MSRSRENIVGKKRKTSEKKKLNEPKLFLGQFLKSHVFWWGGRKLGKSHKEGKVRGREAGMRSFRLSAADGWDSASEGGKDSRKPHTHVGRKEDEKEPQGNPRTQRKGEDLNRLSALKERKKKDVGLKRSTYNDGPYVPSSRNKSGGLRYVGTRTSKGKKVSGGGETAGKRPNEEESDTLPRDAAAKKRLPSRQGIRFADKIGEKGGERGAKGYREEQKPTRGCCSPSENELLSGDLSLKERVKQILGDPKRRTEARR